MANRILHSKWQTECKRQMAERMLHGKWRTGYYMMSGKQNV